MRFKEVGRGPVALALAGAFAIGCSSSDSSTPGSHADAGASASSADGAAGSQIASDAAGSGSSIEGGATSQTPPMGAAAVEAWLAGGAYKQWHVEAAVHAARSPSPHGFDRVYSNAIVNANAGGSGDWPVGAAAVKELFASVSDTTPVGYAVYLKTQADSAGGANWYWYERVPLSSGVPHDPATGVVADGLGGGTGPANQICVSCHVAAGSDPAHTPTAHGRDEVYTPLP